MQDSSILCSLETTGELCCMRWEYSFCNSPTQTLMDWEGSYNYFSISQGQNGTAMQLKLTNLGFGKYFLYVCPRWGTALQHTPTRGMSGMSRKWRGNIFQVKPHHWGHIILPQWLKANLKVWFWVKRATFLCRHAHLIGKVDVQNRKMQEEICQKLLCNFPRLSQRSVVLTRQYKHKAFVMSTVWNAGR